MNRDELRMSAKERDRLVVMGQVASGALTLVAGARALGISYRQAKRLWRGYRERGALGLVHGLRGQVSNRRLGEAHRTQVLEAYRAVYQGFGPTLASEKLAQREGLAVSRETLRRWLHEERLYVSGRLARQHRRRRERRERFGEMVQMDGSHHDWFEGRGAACCLLVLVDDATGRMAGRFGPEETTQLAFAGLRRWIERHGVPGSLYVDRKSQYAPLREPNEEERRAGSGALTDFTRACRRLDLRPILAHSPQAKGRVERCNGTLQDRLVKELRLRGINDQDGANAMLEGFLDDLSERFAQPARSPVDAHRRRPAPEVLDDILCLEQTRAVQNDWTIRYEGHSYQIDRQVGMPHPRQRVIVRRRYDGSLAILYQERLLQFRPIAAVHRLGWHPPHPLGGEEGATGRAAQLTAKGTVLLC